MAFVVCQAIGLDTNTAAADYVRLYDGNKETLLVSVERIQQTAAGIIEGILPPADEAGGESERDETAFEPLPVM